MSAWLQSKWQSLVFRLLLYFLLAFVALAIIVGASFAKRFRPHLEQDILPNLERYVDYLIADIGSPPDLEVARELAASLPIEIRIEGGGLDWSSSRRLRASDSYALEAAPPPYTDVYIGNHRRDEVLLVRRDPYRYLFALDRSFSERSERRHGALFLALAAVFLALYFAIRRLFRPVAEISRQVELIGQGDLDRRVAAAGSGELAALAAGVNHMAAQIKAMLESKSALLLAVSHELRSPMTRMRVNLELLDASDPRDQLIADLREMEALLAAILESEKLNQRHAPLALVRTELAGLIEAVAAEHSCRNRIKRRLTPVEIEVDPMRIGLLLKNLLDNACRYTHDDAGLIEIELEVENERVRISVRDRGIGIAPDEVPRLTEAFYRPDSARRRDTGGYGLGLYLCRLIVAAHHGRLTIESEPGAGTRISVELPRDNS